MVNHHFSMCTCPKLQPNLHLPETRPPLFLNLMQTEDNGRHLQTGSAQRWRRGWLGVGGDEFNPKRQITRSSLRCPSLELTLRRAAHEERVCHPASLRRTCTRAEHEHRPHEVGSATS